MNLSIKDILNSLSSAEIRCGKNVAGQVSDMVLDGELVFDSRRNIFPEHSVFIALRTQAGDGHRFTGEVYNKGIRVFILQDEPGILPDDAVCILVPDTMKALNELTKAVRASSLARYIAITGSCCKTLVKEALYASLCPYLSVSRTPGSYNSAVGVPVGMLSLDSDASLAIVEAGVDGEGQMKPLAKLILPDIGVLTPITDEHDAGFASGEEKIREKIKLFESCRTIFALASEKESLAILRETYPDKNIVEVEGNNPVIALTEAVVKYFVPNVGDNVFEPVKIISSRSHVDEGVRGSVVIRDNFTNDRDSILRAIDALARRGRRENPLVVIAREPLLSRHPQADAEAVLDAAARVGVTRFFGIGETYTKVAPRSFLRPVTNERELLKTLKEEDIAESLVLVKGGFDGDLEAVHKKLLPARHDTVMRIDLDNLLHNFRYFRTLCDPSTRLIAMVKASAYGLGSVEIARSLQTAGAAYLAVAVIEEGIALRKGGISMPIMVLNPITSDFSDLFAYNLQPTVFSLPELDVIASEAEKCGVKEFWPIHIKLDTGMHRLGFKSEELEDLAKALKEKMPLLRVSTAFSHLATADCLDMDEYTEGQIRLFRKMTSRLKSLLPYPIKLHLLNTAGIQRYGKTEVFDFARLGIGLYGVSPLPYPEPSILPVASLSTTIISLRTLHQGEKIGYGCHGTATEEPTVIATVPIGYADGIDRHFGRGRASFVVNGVKCPTVGNICMDLCMIDVTNAAARIGDRAHIIYDNESLQALAEARDTIPYEVLTAISPRVKRLYTL